MRYMCIQYHYTVCAFKGPDEAPPNLCAKVLVGAQVQGVLLKHLRESGRCFNRQEILRWAGG